MAKYFINLSNHSSDKWSEEQISSAKKLAEEIVDIRFPNVDPSATSFEVADMASTLFVELMNKFDDVIVHVMGEMTFTCSVVMLCKEYDIRCVASTTQRMSEEIVLPDGSTKKTLLFKFVQFRDY